jgi:hypothetical protein
VAGLGNEQHRAGQDHHSISLEWPGDAPAAPHCAAARGPHARLCVPVKQRYRSPPLP